MRPTAGQTHPNKDTKATWWWGKASRGMQFLIDGAALGMIHTHTHTQTHVYFPFWKWENTAFGWVFLLHKLPICYSKPWNNKISLGLIPAARHRRPSMHSAVCHWPMNVGLKHRKGDTCQSVAMELCGFKKTSVLCVHLSNWNLDSSHLF